MTTHLMSSRHPSPAHAHMSRNVSTTRENVLSKLEYIELCFWIAFLVFVAIVVGVYRSLVMSRPEQPTGHARKLELVEDDPEGIDPMGDLIGILS